MPRREETTRLCALTRQEKPIADLIRFVVDPEGALVPDIDARAEGRGVWVTLSEEAVREAVKKKAFSKSLKTELKVPEDLAELTRTRLEQRVFGALSMARKASQIMTGATKVRAALEKGEVIALLTATDAAADGRGKIVGLYKALNYDAEEGAQVPHFEILSSDQMGLALGLENVIHAALVKGAAARSALARIERLVRYGAK
jgi:predicted RNA-binding protein YlxR (DUF448 family)